jgi:hypothetical protein
VTAPPLQFLTGWISCATSGREEFVGISEGQREQLAAGSLVCPSCEAACTPRFRQETVRTDVRVLSWRDGRWQPGFVLS